MQYHPKEKEQSPKNIKLFLAMPYVRRTLLCSFIAQVSLIKISNIKNNKRHAREMFKLSLMPKKN